MYLTLTIRIDAPEEIEGEIRTDLSNSRIVRGLCSHLAWKAACWLKTVWNDAVYMELGATTVDWEVAFD